MSNTGARDCPIMLCEVDCLHRAIKPEYIGDKYTRKHLTCALRGTVEAKVDAVPCAGYLTDIRSASSKAYSRPNTYRSTMHMI